jgi:hypothetical protein
VTVRDGKTGFRTANTMQGAVAAYLRIKRRYPNAKGEDYLFFPHYPNRDTASRIVQRQFNAAMERAKIKHDPFTNTEHTVYSLRHTAICMRIICQKVASIFSILPKMREHPWIRSNASMPAIFHCRKKWRSTCRLLGVSDLQTLEWLNWTMETRVAP